MELEDHPPELHEHIIGFFVNTVGIREAWKARKVCKSFAGDIKLNITVRQPTATFLEKKDRRFVQRILPALLESRMVRRNCVSDTLHGLIRKIVDVFVEVSDNDTRETYTKPVCEAIAANARQACDLALCPGQVTISSLSGPGATGLSEALVVAVILKDHGLLDRLLRHKSIPSSEGAVFGDTLDAITFHGNANAIQRLMKVVQPAQDLSGRSTQLRYFRVRIQVALMTRQDGCATEIVRWRLKNLDAPQNYEMSSWVDTALTSRALQFLDTLFSHASVRETKDIYRDLMIGRERYPNFMPEVINMLLHHDVFNATNVNDSYASTRSRPLRGNNREAQSLLNIAVLTNDVDAVRTVLDIGANADGIECCGGSCKRSYPLLLAIEARQSEIAQVLIDHGADPEVGCSTRTVAVLKIQDMIGYSYLRTDIWKVMDKAIRIKHGAPPASFELLS